MKKSTKDTRQPAMPRGRPDAFELGDGSRWVQAHVYDDAGPGMPFAGLDDRVTPLDQLIR